MTDPVVGWFKVILGSSPNVAGAGCRGFSPSGHFIGTLLRESPAGTKTTWISSQLEGDISDGWSVNLEKGNYCSKRCRQSLALLQNEREGDRAHWASTTWFDWLWFLHLMKPINLDINLNSQYVVRSEEKTTPRCSTKVMPNTRRKSLVAHLHISPSFSGKLSASDYLLNGARVSSRPEVIDLGFWVSRL